jgi:alpha-galactosidase/6-phospho-beta-glucosidase family protein
MGQQIKALTQGPDIVHVVNIPNEGAIPNLPDWALVEVKAVVGQHGARPVFVGDLPAQAARWTLAQIYAHELTIEAAAEQSRSKAIQALACDPMIRDFHEAEQVLDALIEVQGDRLASFVKR